MLRRQVGLSIWYMWNSKVNPDKDNLRILVKRGIFHAFARHISLVQVAFCIVIKKLHFNCLYICWYCWCTVFVVLVMVGCLPWDRQPRLRHNPRMPCRTAFFERAIFTRRLVCVHRISSIVWLLPAYFANYRTLMNVSRFGYDNMPTFLVLHHSMQ